MTGSDSTDGHASAGRWWTHDGQRRMRWDRRGPQRPWATFCENHTRTSVRSSSSWKSYTVATAGIEIHRSENHVLFECLHCWGQAPLKAVGSA